MPAGVSAYVPLANVTLSSSAASVTFSSISQAYRDLVLVVTGLTDNSSATSSLRLRFNGNTGTNYFYVTMEANGSATFSTSRNESGINSGYNYPIFNNSTNASYIANLMDYSATDKHKITISRADGASTATSAVAGRWNNTAAITSIQVTFENNVNFVAGSTFALYGVSA